ncbi:MAG: restriction endonuclease subunit S [Candidatus Sedimenticola sp. 6PFRAG5]
MITEDLPDGWALASIKETMAADAVVSDGDWVESKDQDPAGNIRLIQLADIGDGNFRNKSERFMNREAADRLNCTYLQKGDVLIARMPDPLGRACQFPGVGQESVTVVDVCLVRCSEGSAFDNKVLKHWINSPSVRNVIALQATGTTRKRITRKKLEALELPVPPLAEQKQIAAKLDELLAQVDTLKTRLDAIPAILKRFRQSVLAAAVSGRLTEEWRSNCDAYPIQDELRKLLKEERKTAWLTEQSRISKRKEVPFDQLKLLKKYKLPVDGYSDDYGLTQIDEAPNEWLVSNIDSVSLVVTGKTPQTSDQSNWGGEIPFISPTQIDADGSITKPVRFVSEAGAKKTPLLPENAILIVCIGTIGKVGYLEKESAFNQQINALIPSGAMHSEFLFIWAKTLHSWLNKTSSAVVNAAIINKSRLCSAPCPVPSLEEQAEIVDRVKQLSSFADQIEQRVKDAQSRVNHLTQSILAKAFRGELTAEWREQHPELISGEHSAEALLARIKAEQEKLKPVKKKRAVRKKKVASA